MLPDFRIRQRDYLLEIARALTQELDLDKLLERILDISIELLAGQAGLIALYEKSRGWRVAVSRGIPSTFIRYLEPWFAQASGDEDADNFEISHINYLLQQLTISASMGLFTGVGLPLTARNKVVGVIFIFRSPQNMFTSNDRILLSSFANQAAVAVQNAQLYTQVSQEKQRMDALINSAADGILVLGPDHRIERANLAFARMLAVPFESIPGSLHNEIVRWAKHPTGLTLEEAEAGGWPLTPNAHLYVEGDLKRQDLQSLPVGLTYAPLMSPEGGLVNVIVTVRDITRFRQAEEIKSTFVSIVSHELKTPVALIKGYVSTLRREDAAWDKDVIQDSLAIIEEEADRLAGMIENLLDASRLQAGGFALKRSDVLLPDLANHIAERLRTQTSQHTIVVDFPPDFPVILADDTRLAQVISNLVSNAIKYSAGGEVRIRGQIRQNQVIICVSDEGPGIAPGDIPYVFDRFYRADDASRKTKGAGLGLYLARAIIEAHGGKIWIDSEVPQGARICFSLPRQMRDEAISPQQ
jgi:signal transduction histidine kinase